MDRTPAAESAGAWTLHTRAGDPGDLLVEQPIKFLINFKTAGYSALTFQIKCSPSPTGWSN